MRRHASPQVLEALVCALAGERVLVRRDNRIGLSSGPELSNRQREMLANLLSEVNAAGVTPPSLKEFAEKHRFTMKDVEAIVQVGIDEGTMIRLSPQIVMAPGALEQLRRSLEVHFTESAKVKVGEMRERWGITRKHAVPIFEYFDARQITSRAGDERSAGPNITAPLNEAMT
jgi:selenocysteine-specific elongation factor